MTSQKIHSYLIKQNQRDNGTLSLKLTLNSRRKYKVSWNINGKQASSSTYITEKWSLRFIGMENLTFIRITFPNPKLCSL
jgi:hypothetical protein